MQRDSGWQSRRGCWRWHLLDPWIDGFIRHNRLVKLHWLADVQSERSQLRACRFVVLMKDAANPQTLCDLHEHRSVLDMDYLPHWRLGSVQGEAKDARAGLTEMDEAGGDKAIDELVQTELVNPIIVYYARFVADHDYLQLVSGLDLADQLNHRRIRFR